MIILECILIVTLFPFWFPLLLIVIGSLILIFGVFLVGLLVVSLGFIIGILKTFYNVHKGLMAARQAILKEIGNSIKLSWWKLGYLILVKYRKQTQDQKKFEELRFNEEKEMDELDEPE